MTWGKASPYLIVAGIFDFLRAICEQSWLIAPALIGIGTSAAVGKVLGATVGGIVGKIAGVAAAYFTTGALLVIGPIMGMAVGFLGWLVLIGALLMLNPRIFKANELALLWAGAGLIIGEMPLVGTLPSLSVTTWRLCHTQIKKERAAFKQWAQEEKAAAEREQAELMARIVAAQQNANLMEEEEAAAFSEEAAQADLNDNEIPAERLRVA